MAKANLTAARLREILHYDPSTGAFTHMEAKQRVIVGSVAGSDATNGYRKHKSEGVTYRGHRLAWLYVHGAWPNGQIDHINGDRSDNRIANLRDVSVKTNRQNMRKSISATGLLGVYRRGDRYRAEIGDDYRTVRLGSFDTPEEAHAAYLEAKRKLHEGCTI